MTQQRFDNTIERVSPARAPSVRSDVAVPLLQSLVVGLLIGIAAGLVIVRMGGPTVTIPALVLAITGLGFVVRVTRTYDQTLWATETRLQCDLDGDEQVGEPQERVIMVNAYGSRNARDEANASAQDTRLAGFLKDAFTNTTTPFLEARGYSRQEIQEWRAMLLDEPGGSGYARWRNRNNHKEGWEFYPDVTIDELLGALAEATR